METRHLSLFRRLRTFSSTCQLLLQQNKGGECEWCVRAPVRRFRIGAYTPSVHGVARCIQVQNLSCAHNTPAMTPARSMPLAVSRSGVRQLNVLTRVLAHYLRTW